MRNGRPIPNLTISDEERGTLHQWTRRPKTAQALAMRERIILACASGKTNTDVAAHLSVTKQLIGKWRSRFLEQRLDGLLDEPRPGTPRKMSDTEVERALAMTLESINLVERWFALITEKQLRRGVFHSTRKLEDTIRNYIDTHNSKPKPFIWTKTADEILAGIARFCKRTWIQDTILKRHFSYSAPRAPSLFRNQKAAVLL